MMKLHQDDFYITGPASALLEFKEMIKQDIMLKCSDLLQPGSRWSHLKTTRMRTVQDIFIRANDRYAEEIIRCLNLADSKPAPTPMTNDCVEEDASTPLPPAQTRMHRHIVGVLRFLVLFRYDLSFPCKILSEGLQKPTEGHWAMAKRLGRYLKGAVDPLQDVRWKQLKSQATAIGRDAEQHDEAQAVGLSWSEDVC